MNLWEMVGVGAYLQTISLFESILLFIMLFLVSLSKLTGWFREKLVTHGMLIILLLSICFVFVQYYDSMKVQFVHRNIFAILWLLGAIGAFILLVRLINSKRRVEDKVRAIADSLIVLATFFLFIDVISIGIVIGRNLI
jgi:hypothetical protein